jgi:Homeodomain-like domain-containing protein
MDTRAKVAELLAQGMTSREVAARLGIAKSTVCYHRRRLHLTIDPKCARRYDWHEIQEYYDAGHSKRECHERFGFSPCSWTAAVKRGAIVARPKALPLEQLLVSGKKRGRWNLRMRLIAAGLKENRCESCGISNWRGEPLTMQLHHLNGDGRDNRLANLVFLCPNCHGQTPNFGTRNRVWEKKAA